MTISVITPACNNWGELQYCIESIEKQTFKDWQHVIVHDGPNPKMRERLFNRGYDSFGQRVFVELGRNWHGFMGGDAHPPLPGHPGTRGGRGSRSAKAVLFGTFLCSGDYITYLDPDCTYYPNHLQDVDAVIKNTRAGFVYTQMRRELDGRPFDVIGDGQPRWGAIDCNAVTHKAELLKTANWRWGGDADWDLIAHFLADGADYAYIPDVSVVWCHASNDI